MKLVIAESGSDEAKVLWTGAERVVSSRLLYPEARAALGRAYHSDRVGKQELPVVRAHVERLWRSVERIGVSADLAREAGELAERHRLRAFDAVHLATAASIVNGETVVVAGDGDLLDAAAGLGLMTARVA